MRHLVDTSVITRSSRDPVGETVLRRSVDGIASCEIVLMEMLRTARSPAEASVMRQTLSDSFFLVPVDAGTVARAVEIQAGLAARSQHRGVPITHLLIAAAAEHAGLTVLHYDADFDLIAEVTGQPTEWVVPQGSVP